LIKKFDRDGDGYISISELTSGLRSMGIFLTPEERDNLMGVFDTNRDGNISDQEIYKVLSTINTKDLANNANENADIALKKLASGAEEHSSMKDYVKFLIKKFDFDSDGIITFNELCDGIHSLNINLTLKERQALMKSLDLDKNGELSGDELFNVLSKVDIRFSKNQLKDQVEHALRKIASGAEDYSSMKEYVKALMNKFDSNYDGFISFDELVQGLKSINISLTSQEK
jgi:Ca2+-binding EF-hand superfamily protein